MEKILYDGIGHDSREFYNVDDFLALMNKEFTYKKWEEDIIFKVQGRENHYQLQFKDWYLPNDFIFFTLNDWIEYSGAELIKV